MRLAAILPTSGEELLILSAQQGIWYHDGTTISPSSGPAQDFAIQYHTYCGIMLHNGNYAFGSPQNGFIIVNPAGQIIWQINKAKGLTNNTVLSMCQDRQGHIWLGLDNGLDYVEINSPFSKIGINEGVGGTAYSSMIHDGNLYFGTNQGLYVKPWLSNDMGPFDLIPQLSEQVWSLSKLGRKVWVGHHKGAFSVQEKAVNELFPQEGAWKILPSSYRPGFAIAGTYTGLVGYRKEGENWEAIGPIAGFSESCRIMEEDEEGYIWVTHFYRGVFRLKLSEDLRKVVEVKSFGVDDGLPSSFSVNVSKIYNEMVFTTLEGIFHYLPKDERFERHTALDSIFADNIPMWLWESPQGQIWFYSEKEFGYLEVEQKGFIYTWKKVLLNRLQTSLVEGFEHVFPYSDEHVFIATEKGFVHYNPSFQSGENAPRQVHICELRDTRSDSIILGGCLLGQTTNPEIILANDINSLHFSFATSQFSQYARTQYRYMLVGFDKKWSEWEEKTEKEYTNLAAGDYEFMLQSRDDMGEASPLTRLTFTIDTPWYLKSYTKGLWVLIMLVGVVTAYALNKRNMNKWEDDLLSEKNAEIKQQAAAFQVVMEKNEEEILKLRNQNLRTEIEYKKQELASATLHLLQKGEMLAKLKNELMRLTKMLPENQKGEVKKIIKAIEEDVKLDENWTDFKHHFDRVHEDFIRRLKEKHPQLPPKDLKLAAYLRMNLVTKEIAPLLNILVIGVDISRYRLRKKMERDRELNLVSYKMTY